MATLSEPDLVGIVMNLDEIIRDMIEVGQRLDQLGFVPANDGNISVRLGPREIVATASGVRKGRLTPKDFVIIDPDGARLRGAPKVSTEIQMHLQIYRDRPDIGAVVHAHPPTATGFATAGIPLHQCVLPEVVATIGAVPLAPYATPSTRELPDSIRPFLPDHDALLLANHGAVTFGVDLFTAACRMETVEQFARILFVARTLGQVNLLTPGQVDSINAIRALRICRRRAGLLHRSRSADRAAGRRPRRHTTHGRVALSGRRRRARPRTGSPDRRAGASRAPPRRRLRGRPGGFPPGRFPRAAGPWRRPRQSRAPEPLLDDQAGSCGRQPGGPAGPRGAKSPAPPRPRSRRANSLTAPPPESDN
jgi:L-fuculose-phosphate aldolase